MKDAVHKVIILVCLEAVGVQARDPSLCRIFNRVAYMYTLPISPPNPPHGVERRATSTYLNKGPPRLVPLLRMHATQGVSDCHPVPLVTGVGWR